MKEEIKVKFTWGALYTSLNANLSFTPARFARVIEFNYQGKDDAYYYFGKGIKKRDIPELEDKGEEGIDMKYDPITEKLIIDCESKTINETKVREILGHKFDRALHDLIDVFQKKDDKGGDEICQY